jgi:hypothetical protein|tara:strand:+ start:6782 stop:7279 length:498 start_codon:yes stop_codon:yes gene_type:complete
MLFGSNRDFNLLVNINRELLKDIVEQEILYYKFSIKDTEVNIYGEGLIKSFLEPLKLNCLITRGDQVVAVDDFGPDLTRDVQFALLRRDLEDVNVVPEVGDILNWQEDYYVVDNVRENQLFMGRDKSYNLTDYGSQFGTSVSLILETHMTRREQTGITFAQNEEY